MKIDLGIGSLELPGGYATAAFTALGPNDVGGPVATGMPTTAKAQTFEHNRVLAISTRDTGGALITIEILRKALSDLKDASQGTLKNIVESEVNAQIRIAADLHHRMEKLPTVTLLMLIGAKSNIFSMMLTVLDDKNAVALARQDFEKVAKTFAVR